MCYGDVHPMATLVYIKLGIERQAIFAVSELALVHSMFCNRLATPGGDSILRERLQKEQRAPFNKKYRPCVVRPCGDDVLRERLQKI